MAVDLVLVLIQIYTAIQLYELMEICMIIGSHYNMIWYKIGMHIFQKWYRQTMGMILELVLNKKPAITMMYMNYGVSFYCRCSEKNTWYSNIVKKENFVLNHSPNISSKLRLMGPPGCHYTVIDKQAAWCLINAISITPQGPRLSLFM